MEILVKTTLSEYEIVLERGALNRIDELLDLNIKNSYYSLNKENTQIVNKIKNALLLYQKKSQ